MSNNGTATGMSTVIGKTGLLQSDKSGLRFRVEIHNVKQAYGRTDYLIKPIEGVGEAWVSSDRVMVD